MIVNAHRTVDKRRFAHSVNGLRAFDCAGKTLYRRGTDVGQKTPACKKRLFCTVGVVDMQRVFHIASGLGSEICVRHHMPASPPTLASPMRQWMSRSAGTGPLLRVAGWRWLMTNANTAFFLRLQIVGRVAERTVVSRFPVDHRTHATRLPVPVRERLRLRFFDGFLDAQRSLF